MLRSDRLILLRKEHALYQKDVADKLGLERTTYSKYETGGIQPPNDMVVKIADCFNVSADYLLGISDEKNPYTEASPDDEVTQLRQMMSEKPGARTLFSLAKTANNDTLEFAGEMIRRMQKESGYRED